MKPCYFLNGKIFKTGENENITCNWQVDGYRLPTEAEWEFASQAGSDTAWHWGDNEGCKYAWRGGKRAYNSNGVSHPVGEKYGNLFGLYDTIGNVWEWTWDWMGPHQLNLDTPQNPKGPSTKKEIFDYLVKVEKKQVSAMERKNIGFPYFYKGTKTLKGGAYNTKFGYHAYINCQLRIGIEPNFSNETTGFRVVRGK